MRLRIISRTQGAATVRHWLYVPRSCTHGRDLVALCAKYSALHDSDSPISGDSTVHSELDKSAGVALPLGKCKLVLDGYEIPLHDEFRFYLKDKDCVTVLRKSAPSSECSITAIKSPSNATTSSSTADDSPASATSFDPPKVESSYHRLLAQSPDVPEFDLVYIGPTVPAEATVPPPAVSASHPSTPPPSIHSTAAPRIPQEKHKRHQRSVNFDVEESENRYTAVSTPTACPKTSGMGAAHNAAVEVEVAPDYGSGEEVGGETSKHTRPCRSSLRRKKRRLIRISKSAGGAKPMTAGKAVVKEPMKPPARPTQQRIATGNKDSGIAKTAKGVFKNNSEAVSVNTSMKSHVGSGDSSRASVVRQSFVKASNAVADQMSDRRTANIPSESSDSGSDSSSSSSSSSDTEDKCTLEMTTNPQQQQSASSGSGKSGSSSTTAASARGRLTEKEKLGDSVDIPSNTPESTVATLDAGSAATDAVQSSEDECDDDEEDAEEEAEIAAVVGSGPAVLPDFSWTTLHRSKYYTLIPGDWIEVWSGKITSNGDKITGQVGLVKPEEGSKVISIRLIVLDDPDQSVWLPSTAPRMTIVLNSPKDHQQQVCIHRIKSESEANVAASIPVAAAEPTGTPLTAESDSGRAEALAKAPKELQVDTLPTATIVAKSEKVRAAVKRQMDYYFSQKAYEADEFLQSLADENGWIPLDVLMGFNRIASLTRDLEFVQKHIGSCANFNLRVDGAAVRRRRS